MEERESDRLRADDRGNLLAISAVALAVLLVVASTTMVTISGPEGGTAPDADAATELVERGIEDELARGSDRTASDTGARPEEARASRSAAARRAVDRAFGDSVGEATRADVAGLLRSVVRQQQRSGEVTWIEPADAGVTHGLWVELGAVTSSPGAVSSAGGGSGPVTVRPAPLAPSDDPQLLFGGATATRDSSLTVVTRTLPVGAANATTVVAVPGGGDPTASDVDWRLTAYRALNGTAVVGINGERTTSDSATVRIGFEGPSVNGRPVGAPTPAAVVAVPFDLYLRRGAGVRGGYSLFAGGADRSGMRSVADVTVERAIDAAAFDVTYQDERTTFTDTVVVRPDHTRKRSVVVAPLGQNGTREPPTAAFEVRKVAGDASTVTYRLDATPTDSDDLLTVYDWTALDHADRVSGLTDGQATQTVTVERSASDYYLPIGLRVVDETGSSDSARRGTIVPNAGTQPDPEASIRITGLNDTHATVEVASTRHTDPARYDFGWSVQRGGDAVGATAYGGGGRTVTYTVARGPLPQPFAVELTVTDTALGGNGSTMARTTVPAGNRPPVAALTASRIGTEPDSVQYLLDASASSDDGSITDIQYTLGGRPLGAASTVDVVRRSDDNDRVVVDIQRRDRPRNFGAGVTVTDDDGATTTARDGVRVPALETGDLRVALSERTRNNDSVTYRVSADATVGRFDWEASGEGSVNGLESGRGLHTQTFTADRQSDDWTLTVSATQQYYGRQRTGSASVTVPGVDGSDDGTDGNTTVPPNRNTGPNAIINATRTDPNATTMTFTLSSDSTDPDGTIRTRRWTENVSDGDITEFRRSGDSMAVTIERPAPDADPRTVGIDLTVTDDDGATDTAETTLTVAPNPTGGVDPRHAPTARLSVTRTDTVESMGQFRVSAANSTDTDGEIVEYDYEIVAGRAAVESTPTDNVTSQRLTAALDSEPTPRLRLTVTDNESLTDSVTVPLEDAPTSWTSGLDADVVERNPTSVAVRLTAAESLDSTLIAGRDYQATVTGGHVVGSLTDDTASQTVTIALDDSRARANFRIRSTNIWGDTRSTTATLTVSPAALNVTLDATVTDRHADGVDVRLVTTTNVPAEVIDSRSYTPFVTSGTLQGALEDGRAVQTMTIDPAGRTAAGRV